MPDALRAFFHLIVTKLQFAHEGEAAEIHKLIDNDFLPAEEKVEAVAEPVAAALDPAVAKVIADLQAEVNRLAASQTAPGTVVTAPAFPSSIFSPTPTAAVPPVSRVAD